MGKDNLYEVCSEAEIEEFLTGHKDWAFAEDRLKASFVLADFEAAVAVMNKVFEVAAKMDHHPRITNTYNRLEFSLCTHSVGDRVTSYDFDLAKAISDIIGEAG
jgi:4a-hydroxytetrahydrobiopterin dehydratase